MEDILTPDTQQVCRFCQIIQREIPSAIVFEDDTSLAFLDRRPLFPGHCLLVAQPVDRPQEGRLQRRVDSCQKADPERDAGGEDQLASLNLHR